MPGLDSQAPVSGRSPLPRAIGYVLLAAGLAGVFLAALFAGALLRGGNEDTQGYDVTRLATLLGLLWIAVAWVLWCAGQIRLLASAVGLAALGFGLGVFQLGALDAGGSEDSKADVGLVIGSAGALIGLFMSWAGARLVWPRRSVRP
jgi:hypothetical protein